MLTKTSVLIKFKSSSKYSNIVVRVFPQTDSIVELDEEFRIKFPKDYYSFYVENDIDYSSHTKMNKNSYDRVSNTFYGNKIVSLEEFEKIYNSDKEIKNE